MAQQARSFTDRNLIPTGKVIDGFEVVSLVGIGGFGEVYKVRDKKTNQMFAMKTEDASASVAGLDNEVACIQQLHDACFPRVRSSGASHGAKYVVMNIYGASLSAVRLKSAEKRLPLSVVLPVGYEMVNVIEKFHAYGYVHRDIKPSNFLVQQNSDAPLVLIDFGLARLTYSAEGHLIDAEGDRQFVGTKKYSSVYAHCGSVLGKRDDMISWFYSLVELAQGALPWGELATNAEALACKEQTAARELCRGMPDGFVQLHETLHHLELEATPDYNGIRRTLADMMGDAGTPLGTFDWLGFYTRNSALADIRHTLQGTGDDADESENALGEGEANCCVVF